MKTPDVSKFKCFFPGLHLPTIKNLLLITLALIQCRTTNVNTLKDALPRLVGHRAVQPASNYKRLLRFFNHPRTAYLIECILEACYQIIGPGKIHMVTLDRTNWKFGTKNINLLVLCYVFKGVSIPLRWRQLDKRGNSTQKERQELLEKAMEVAHLSRALLLADREFIGEDWFDYLAEQGIPFLIRLPRHAYHDLVNTTGARRHRMLLYKAGLKRGMAHTPITLKGHRLYYFILKGKGKETEEPFLYFLTNQKPRARKKHLDKYRRRWTIECLFKHLKTNGFNLEQLHFKSNLKIELMMALVVLAYCLTIYHAFQKIEPQNIKLKLYKRENRAYKEQSVFRLGLSLLLQWVATFEAFCDLVLRILIVDNVFLEPKTVQ